MKVLRCEMCGNTGLIKKDGVYICEACGTKYTLDEAKKMLVDGTVAIKGAVKIDKATDEQNLIILARRAYKSKEYAKARNLYVRASEINPNDWESTFYATYCEKGYVWACRDALTLSLNLIKTTIKNKRDQKKAIFTIVDSVFKEFDTFYDPYRCSTEIRVSFSSTPTLTYIYSWAEILTHCFCGSISSIDDTLIIRKGIVERVIKKFNSNPSRIDSFDYCRINRLVQENITKIRNHEPDYTPESKMIELPPSPPPPPPPRKEKSAIEKAIKRIDWDIVLAVIGIIITILFCTIGLFI